MNNNNIINNPQKVKIYNFFREKLINEFIPNYIDFDKFQQRFDKFQIIQFENIVIVNE